MQVLIWCCICCLQELVEMVKAKKAAQAGVAKAAKSWPDAKCCLSLREREGRLDQGFSIDNQQVTIYQNWFVSIWSKSL